MADDFDPYLHWLGIRDPQRPPNHYALLGVTLFENDPNVLSNAADRQMAHLRTFQRGERGAMSQRLLNEIAAAKICLLNAEKKAAYDARLRQELAAASPATPPAAAYVPGASGPEPLVPAPVPIEAGSPPRGFPVSTVLISILSLTALVLLVLILKFTVGQEEPPAENGVAQSQPQDTNHDNENGQKPTPEPAPPTPPTPEPTPPTPTPTPPTPEPTPPEPTPPTPTPPTPTPLTPEPTPPTPEPTPPTPEPTPPTPTPAEPPGDARKPLPPAHEVSEAIKIIHDLFAEEYNAAITAPARRQLPQALLKKAAEESGDPVARYALYEEARDQAIEVGDPRQFENAVTALGKEYRIEWSDMAAASLQKVLRKSRDVAVQRQFAQSAIKLAKRAAGREAYPAALQMAEAARDMARDVSRRTKDTKDRDADYALVREAVALMKDLDTQSRQHATFLAAQATLAQNPDDAAANLVVGRHLCLVRKDWSEGLPLLARSGDAQLVALVNAESDPPSDAAAKAARADLWYDAMAQADEANRPLLAARAAYWYRQAVPGLSGLARVRVEKRLEEVAPK